MIEFIVDGITVYRKILTNCHQYQFGIFYFLFFFLSLNAFRAIYLMYRHWRWYSNCLILLDSFDVKIRIYYFNASAFNNLHMPRSDVWHTIAKLQCRAIKSICVSIILYDVMLRDKFEIPMRYFDNTIWALGHMNSDCKVYLPILKYLFVHSWSRRSSYFWQIPKYKVETAECKRAKCIFRGISGLFPFHQSNLKVLLDHGIVSFGIHGTWHTAYIDFAPFIFSYHLYSYSHVNEWLRVNEEQRKKVRIKRTQK